MTDYNHMSNSVTEAIGVTQEEFEKTMMFIQKAFQASPIASKMIQHIESVFDSAPQAFKRTIIMMSVQSYLQSMTEFKELVSSGKFPLEDIIKGRASSRVKVLKASSPEELIESLKGLAKELDETFGADSNPDENEEG